MVLRYPCCSQDQVSLLYYDKVIATLFCFSEKIRSYLPFGRQCFVSSSSSSLCTCSNESEDEKKKERKETEDKIQPVVKDSSGGVGGQREGKNEGER